MFEIVEANFQVQLLQSNPKHSPSKDPPFYLRVCLKSLHKTFLQQRIACLTFFVDNNSENNFGFKMKIYSLQFLFMLLIKVICNINKLTWVKNV